MLGAGDGVTDSSGVGKDLIIITALVGLVAEKVNLFKAFTLDMPKRICLVPALGENVKTNLTANRKSQSKMQKLSLELGDHVSPNTMLLVILFKIDSLLDGCVSADRGDVDHTVSKFDKRASLDGNVHFGEIPQNPIDKLLILLLSYMLDKTRRLELLAQLVRDQPILCKPIVKIAQPLVPADLLQDLGEVGATHKGDGAALTEFAEGSKHLGGRALTGERKGAIDVKHADGLGEPSLGEGGDAGGKDGGRGGLRGGHI